MQNRLIILLFLLSTLGCKKDNLADKFVGSYCAMDIDPYGSIERGEFELTRISDNKLLLKRTFTVPHEFEIKVKEGNRFVVEYQKFEFNANSTCEDYAIHGDGKYYPSESRIELNTVSEAIDCNTNEILGSTEHHIQLMVDKVDKVASHYENGEMKADLIRNADGTYKVSLDYFGDPTKKFKFLNLEATKLVNGCYITVEHQRRENQYTNDEVGITAYIAANATGIVVFASISVNQQNQLYPSIYLHK